MVPFLVPFLADILPFVVCCCLPWHDHVLPGTVIKITGINRPPLSETILHIPRVPNPRNTPSGVKDSFSARDPAKKYRLYNFEKTMER